MSKIPAHVLKFAGEANMGVYNAFVDYFNQYRTENSQNGKKWPFATTSTNEKGEIVPISFMDKEQALNVAMKREIMRANLRRALVENNDER